MVRLGWIVLVAGLVLAAGLAIAAEQVPEATPSTGGLVGAAPAAEPPQHVPMDHGEPSHHHHAHKGDHRGAEHAPAGLGDHHHHHHNHPHTPDPHHHHPH